MNRHVYVLIALVVAAGVASTASGVTLTFDCHSSVTGSASISWSASAEGVATMNGSAYDSGWPDGYGSADLTYPSVLIIGSNPSKPAGTPLTLHVNVDGSSTAFLAYWEWSLSRGSTILCSGGGGYGEYSPFHGDITVYAGEQLTVLGLVRAEGTEPCSASLAVDLTADSIAPTITQQPVDQIICGTGSATFGVAATGTPPFTYQWRRGTTNLVDGGNISGATTSTLTINPVGPSDAASDYNCVVADADDAAVSNNAALIVGAAASVSGQPSDQVAPLGGSASFTVIAAGPPAPTYQWRRGTTNLADGGNIGGATAATLTISPVGEGDYAADYNCVVTNACGTGTSNNAALILSLAAFVSQQPTDQLVCPGAAASFTIVATGNPEPTYQWRRGTNNLVDDGHIAGATAATLTINPASADDAATDYNCVVTNEYGTDTSNNAALTLNAAVAIVTQPVDTSACNGSTLQLRVITTGASPRTYQWRRGTVPLSNGGDFHNVTTPTLRIDPLSPGDSATDYNCVITNTCGSVTSNNAAVTVNAAPVITTYPTNQWVCSGSSASFSVAVTASPAPTYQWRKGTTNLTDGGRFSGATSPTLTINPVTSGDVATNYTCVITNSCGSTATNNTSLSLNDPGFLSQPSNQTACSGGSAHFAVAAKGGTLPRTFQWRRGTTNLADNGHFIGTATNALWLNAIVPSDAGADYNCVITNACGSATSNYVALTVNVGPAISVPPTDQVLVVGGSATFGVTVDGNPAPTYQWRKDTVPLTDGGSVSGATTATLTINPAAATDAGRYDVVVTNSCGSATSALAGFWRRGDTNCDGLVNYADINPFVLALSNQVAYEAQYPNCEFLNADASRDSVVNYADINPFVALLSGS